MILSFIGQRIRTIPPSKVPIISFIKNSYPHCLVLVRSRNGFERDFTMELKQIEGLIEDLNFCKKLHR